MERRLVIPAKAKPDDIAWPDNPARATETWADVAKDNGVGIAVQGDEWCVANRFPADGLGIASEWVEPPPPAPTPDPVELPTIDPKFLADAQATVASTSDALGAALDPAKANPTTAERLKTLEQTVALLIARLEG